MGLIHGADSTGKAIPLLVDASGQAIVTQTTPGNMLVGSHGWDGAAWRKNPISFGYSGRLFRYMENLTLAAGNSNIADSAVPAGEIWVFTQVNVVYIGTSPSYVYVRIWNPTLATGFIMIQQLAPVSSQWYLGLCNVVLVAGEYLQTGVVGATLNDDLVGKAIGYKVQINV